MSPVFHYNDGSLAFPPPFEEAGSLMLNYLFEAETDKLQAVCDSWFGPVQQNSQYRYQPLLPLVMVTFSDNKRARPLSKPFANWGVVAYKEVIFSFFVVRLKKTATGWVTDRVGAFVPYIFVDDSIAMIAGREVYGMPKNIGWIDMPESPQQTAIQCALQTVSTKTFEAGQPFEKMPIAGISSDGPLRHEVWQDMETAFAALKDLIFGGGQIHLPDLRMIIEVADIFLKQELPFCAFRQLLSVEQTNSAIYQSAIDFAARMEHFHGGGLIHGKQVLSLPDNALFPIADNLGLKSGQIAKAAFWLDWDFAFQTGQVIWSSQARLSFWEWLKQRFF